MLEPLLLRPEEAAEVLRVGRTEIFRLMRRGEIESLLIGARRRRIPTAALRAYIERLRRDQGRRLVPAEQTRRPPEGLLARGAASGRGPSTASTYTTHLLPKHAALLEASAVVPEVAAARGYRSIQHKVALETLGFAAFQRNVPGLLIPVHGVDGELKTYQYRPDAPRVGADGRVIKYETPAGSRLVLDVPPPVRGQLRDPNVPLFVTEGARKADAAVSAGLACVALLGVWGWRGTNDEGGKTALADWENVALNGRDVFLAFDSDVIANCAVYAALARLKSFLEARGARVRVVYLPAGPNGEKVGLDDFLAAGHSVDELFALADELRPPPKDERVEREAQEALVKARALLKDAQLLAGIARAIRAQGYAGDARPALLAYLALTSRLLPEPLNLALVAPSAAGKNRAVDAALALMPDTAYYKLSAASPRALIYNDESFAHRTVVLAEADSLPDEGSAASAIRAIISDGYLWYETVERDEVTGAFATRRIEKEGPTGLITTSTKPLPKQSDTRVLTVAVADTPGQTRRVLRMHAAAVNGARPAVDVEPFIALQRWLELAGARDVTVPFAHKLAELVPADQVRVRRDFRQLLTLIQAVALLHQSQRERDGHGRVVATLQDYAIARALVLDAFETAATGGVSPVVRETAKAVREIHAMTGEPVMLQVVAERLGLAKSTTLYRLRAAIRLGYVVNLETGKGRPARLVPGEPLPEKRLALPYPRDLRIVPEDHPEIVRTVEPCPSSQIQPESTERVQNGVRTSVGPSIEPERVQEGVQTGFKGPIEPSRRAIPDSKSTERGGRVQWFNPDPRDRAEALAARSHLVQACLEAGLEPVAVTPPLTKTTWSSFKHMKIQR